MPSFTHIQTLGGILLAYAVLLADGLSTTYVVALLGQDVQNGTAVNVDIQYELVMTNTAGVSITVNVSGIGGLIETVNIASAAIKTLTYNSTMALNGSEYANKSLIINSTESFVLQVFTKRLDRNHVEGFLGVSIEQLAEVSNGVYDYTVATFCATGGYCQLAVASIEDQTPIFIALPANVEEIAVCKQKSYFRTGRDTTITLNKYDVLHLETTYDLTGTHIYSYKPIVVYAGSRNVTTGNETAHTVEQLVPASFWGDEYVVRTIGSTGYGDILKFASAWTETMITMTGYPPFVIKDSYSTVVRKLDKGMKAHIKATHPIQVVQISGLTYATNNETSALGMTVVPSVQNAWAKFNVACYPTSNNAAFHIVSGKGISATVTGGTVNITESIYYSSYQIRKFLTTAVTSAQIVTSSGTETVNGILQCGSAATMPLGIIFNQNATRPSKPDTSYTGGICYEGGKGSTKFAPTTGLTVPTTLNLTEHPDHVLKLRVRACGEAVLQFYTTDNSFSNSLIVTITNKQVVMKKCFPDCTAPLTKTISNTGATGVQAWNCSADMSFLWFRQISGTTLRFCIGTELRSTDCSDTSTDTFYSISSRFVKVTMMGLFADADFHWDLDHPGGCTSYEGDWRCADRWTNCSAFGTQFCTDTTYDGFARTYCSKYCGKCFADSYGNKFLLRLPAMTSTYCKIIVSPLNLPTQVAVFYEHKNNNPKTVIHGDSSEGVRSYDCLPVAGYTYMGINYTIIADREVSVVVIYRSSGAVLASFRVFPVDAYGLEHMVLNYNPAKNQEDCFFMSEYDEVKMTPYLRNVLVDSQRTTYIDDGKTYNITKDVDLLLRTNTQNDLAGILFVFDKPSTVFCGMTTNGINYNQILPTNTWSKNYYIPAFDLEPINRPFDAKLKIIAYTDNTLVTLSKGFDAVHAMYNKGNTVLQSIDLASTYYVNATEKIAVGIYLYDPSNLTKSSFHILTSKENMHDTIVTSVPNNFLKDASFSVDSVKTYFVDAQGAGTTIEKPASDVSMFYRHVSLNDAKFGFTVVKAVGFGDWFVIPCNAKANVLTQFQAQSYCATSKAIQGDGVDNDCDGTKDEDVCFSNYGVYKEDHDLGGFGDDCRQVITEPQIVTKPIDPSCLEINKPKEQCWTVCTCKCSDVERYEIEKNMTREQLEEAYEDKNKEMQKQLQVDTSKLTATTIEKESASDERQSAANIGYVGIALFVIVFGFIIILDASSLYRDAKILARNLKEGGQRLLHCFRR